MAVTSRLGFFCGCVEDYSAEWHCQVVIHDDVREQRPPGLNPGILQAKKSGTRLERVLVNFHPPT